MWTCGLKGVELGWDSPHATCQLLRLPLTTTTNQVVVVNGREWLCSAVLIAGEARELRPGPATDTGADGEGGEMSGRVDSCSVSCRAAALVPDVARAQGPEPAPLSTLTRTTGSRGRGSIYSIHDCTHDKHFLYLQSFHSASHQSGMAVQRLMRNALNHGLTKAFFSCITHIANPNRGKQLQVDNR